MPALEKLFSIFGNEMSKLDWNNLKYFLAVARTGGLTPAAEQLNTSASTVSRHLDAMEATLNMRLFLRQQRGYLLTDEGSAILEQVIEVERAMQSMERQGAAVAEIEGEVKLATLESIAHYLLVPHLPTFTARYPQVRVELLVNRHLADLSRREADLALRIADPRQRDHAPDDIAHCIGTFNFELYCTHESLEQAGDWLKLPHISWDAAWVKLPMVEWLHRLFPEQVPLLRSNTMQAHYLAALSGLGAALLPRFIGDKDTQLLRIDTGLPPMQQELWLLYHRDLKGSRRVLAMRDFIEEVCRIELAKYA